MPTTTEVRRFAYQQGTGRVLFDVMSTIDDSILTSSLAPPQSARGDVGWRLPLGTEAALAAARYPGRAAVPPPEVLGHVLLAAVGLQRREPANRFNDHRVVASVRAKFPVHLFVLSPSGTAYLDVYRHALVELPTTARADETTIVLAGRYTDYPSFYDVLRGALAELEVGYNLRSLFTAAQLFGVPAALDLGGTDARDAADLVRGAGPGQWSTALRVRLAAAFPEQRVPLAGSGAFTERDRVLAGTDAHLEATAAICAPVLDLPHAPGAPAPGIASLPEPADIDWAEVLWRRTAGRVSEQGNGFSAISTTVAARDVREMAAWASVAAPHELLREVQRRVRLSVALQHVAGYRDGVYRCAGGTLHLAATDQDVMHTLDRDFGYHDAPDTELGLRHSNATWLLSVDLDALLADLGPAGWTLLQLTCGWIAHGLSLAAAANDYFARPARGFDEVRLRRTMRLPRGETPVFMTICGKSRFTETMLDLRT